MELYYTDEISGGRIVLAEDEFRHCCKVMRHSEGAVINVIDGSGTLFKCRIVTVTSSRAEAEVVDMKKDFGSHGYRLSMAVAPTKNMDRYEWFLEKAVEMGIDACIPVITARSERKVIKTERLQRVALSAVKQSLKGKMPDISVAVPYRNFLEMMSSCSGLKVIAYCGTDYEKHDLSAFISLNEEIFYEDGLTVLIGPEGDFSEEEVRMAVESGFVPVSLGRSRLRTETAALVAVSAAYLAFSRTVAIP